MERKIHIDRLSKSELSYELAIRGLPDSNVDSMRKSLRQLMKMEQDQSVLELPAHPFTFEEDSDAISTALIELNTALESFDDSVDSNPYKKLQSRLSHLLGRAAAMKAKDEASASKRAEFIQSILGLMSDIHDKASVPQVTDEVAIQLGLGLSVGEAIVNSPAGNPAASSTLAAPDPQCGQPKSVPVFKWGLDKFAGHESKISLNAFLQQVDELSIARNVSKTQLFASALDLFKDQALLFYRSRRNEVSDWDSLVKLLKEEYLPLDYDDKLLEEIRRRTQGPNEPLGTYLVAMDNLFSRLSTKFSEGIKLRLLLKNLAPFYQFHLSFKEINSISDLLQFGRQLEASRLRADSYVPPTRRKTDLEPDLAFVETASNSSSAASDVSSRLCFNCRKTGHVRSACSSPLIKRCFGCGEMGVTKTSCKKCSPRDNNSGNGRTRH